MAFIEPGEDGEARIRGRHYSEFISDGQDTIIIDRGEITRNLGNLAMILDRARGDRNIAIEIFYSMKTNNNDEVLAHVAGHGCGVEVVSEHELEIALRYFPPEKIIAEGPGKPTSYLEKALVSGVKTLYLNSIDELKEVYDITGDTRRLRENTHTNLGLSLTLNGQDKNSIKIKGEAGRKALRVLRECPIKDRITSFHLHQGTQLDNDDAFLESVESLVYFASKARDEAGIDVRSVNLGGGIPEAGVAKKKRLESIYARCISLLCSEIEIEHVAVEPGRYIVGSAGIILTKVRRKRDWMEDDPWIYLGTGINAVPKFAMARHRFIVARDLKGSYSTTYNIAGPTPAGFDVFVKHYPLTSGVEAGDIIIITNAGAYCLPFLGDFCVPKPRVVIT